MEYQCPFYSQPQQRLTGHLHENHGVDRRRNTNYFCVLVDTEFAVGHQLLFGRKLDVETHIYHKSTRLLGSVLILT